MKRGLLATFVLGSLGAVLFVLYQYQGEIDISGMWEMFLSYFQRGYSIVKDDAQTAVGQENYFDKAVALIAGFESFSAKPYWDVDGYSIGYGHHFVDGDGFNENSVLTASEAQSLLESDLQSRDSCIDQSVNVELSVNQRAALLSLVYNIGCGNFSKSTLVKELNQGDYESAAAQFSVWRMAGGQINQTLVDRRASEEEIFSA